MLGKLLDLLSSERHPSKERRAFLISVEAGDVNGVKAFLQKGLSANEKDKEGNTILMLAVKGGYKDIVKLLIDAGADINFRSRNACNPLMRDGSTALILAVFEGNKDIVQLLVDAGADVNLPDYYGETPLMFAAKNPFANKAEIFKLLIKAGSNVNAKNNENLSALHYVAQRAKGDWGKNATSVLIDAGVDINAQDDGGRTVLDFALNHPLSNKDKDVLSMLVNAGAKGYCAACLKKLRSFSSPSGIWTGTMSEALNLPSIEPDHGLVCEQCRLTICPICSGKKAGELGISEFVCTQCGYNPLRTIYRG